jgi:hypothetical protein
MKKSVTIRFLVLLLFTFISHLSISAPTSGECADMKSHFNSVDQAQRNNLIRTCKDIYTQGIGWTNSATGCGRCPTQNVLCENSPTACAQVQALEGMKTAVAQWTQGINDKYLEEATEKVQNIRMVFISDQSQIVVPLFQTYRRESPSINSMQSIEIDEVITLNETGFYSECVIPLNSFEKEVWGYTHSVIGNMPLCKMKAKDKNYHGTYFNKIKPDTGVPSASFPYSIKAKKKGIDICQRAMGMSAGCSKKNKEEEFIFGWGFVTDVRDPHNQLIFRGGSAEELFLEYIGSNETKKFVHNVSQNPVFECGNYALNIEFTDGKVLTYQRVSGEVTELETACSSLQVSSFPEPKESSSKKPLERLDTLDKLKKSGLISEEEFAEKRREILSEL